MNTKNEELRKRTDIHGSTLVNLNFDEILELLHVLDGGTEPEPYHYKRARGKLVDARNHIFKRGGRTR